MPLALRSFVLTTLVVAATFMPLALCVEEMDTEAEAADKDAKADASAEEAAATPIVLNCDGADLLEAMDTWTIDCVAQWLENMGFGELKGPFMENRVGGLQLKELTLEQLREEYGVADEDNQKKIVYALKDVLRKDNYRGNTNNWAQFFMWALPFLAIYKWITIKYEKQITRMTKRYQKWQEAKAPVEVSSPVAADASNEWIAGVNSDVGGGRKKEKRSKKVQ